jgi:hypothetical protein
MSEDVTTVVYSETLGLFRCEVLGRNDDQVLIRVEDVARPMVVPAKLIFELEDGQAWREGKIVEANDEA